RRLHLDSVILVGDRRVAGGVGSDVVAARDLTRPRTAESDAVVDVAGNHVSARGGRSADQDAGGRSQRLDPGLLSGDRVASARVGADEVAQHEVIRAAPTRSAGLPV